MTPFWIETGTAMRLAIVPRPRGNDWLKDEVTQMKRAGVDVLVSMLQPDGATELGLSARQRSVRQEGSSSGPSRFQIERRRRLLQPSPIS